MSTIAAGTSTGTALVSTGNTDGTLQLQVNGTTPSVTLATTGAIGVGSSPSYGTSGQVLQSGGSSAAPTWATASASAMTFLSTVTISNSATADVETTFNSTYDTYMIVGKINTTTGTNPTLNCRLKVGGSYVTASYDYHADVSNSNATTYAGIAGAAAAQIVMTSALGANDAYSVDFVMYVQNPTSTTEQKSVFWTGRSRSSVGYQVKSYGQGAYTGATTALTGVRFYTSADNLVGGTIRLYGIAKS